MRTWVEKLAKHIENSGTLVSTEGYFGGGTIIRTKNYKIGICRFGNDLTITKLNSNIHANIKLYEDEFDLMVEVRKKVIENTKDDIINELNNLE